MPGVFKGRANIHVHKLPMPYVGAILTDSLLAFPPGRLEETAMVVLKAVYRETGLSFLLVVKPGARIGDGGAGSYADMLLFLNRYLQATNKRSIAQSSLQYLLLVSGGNDIYSYIWSGWYQSGSSLATTLAGAKALARSMRDFSFGDAPVQRAACIFGGSSTLWRYRAWAAVEDCDRYDQDVAQVVTAMKEYLTVGDGVEELTGVEIVDRIGHVSPQALQQMAQAVVKWVSMLKPRAKM